MKHEILSLLLKLWIICVIGFMLFCIGRGFNHFPKHEERHAVKTTEAAFSKIATFLAVGPALFGYNIDKAKELLFPPAVSKRSIKDMPFVFGGEAHKTALPAEVEMYEAVKTAVNSYEILRRVK